MAIDLIQPLATALGAPAFVVQAGLAAIGLALAAGPLGCFVLWRRMAYFGEATAHTALLGVALGLAWNAPDWLGALVVAAAMAAAVSALSESGRTGADALLGVFSHAALALGLIALSLTPGSRPDVIMGALFGEILAVTASDLAIIWGGGALVLGALAWRWRALVSAAISSDMALAEGGRPGAERLALTLGLAIVIAVAMQVVGLLLVTALLILPPAAARPLSRTPEAMAAMAAALGAASAVLGLWLSFETDAPAGASIVAAAFAAFILTSLGAALWRAWRMAQRRPDGSLS